MFDAATLQRLVGDQTYSRGETYWREGRVKSLSVSGAHIRATVVGSESYRVELRKQGSGFTGSCTCPAFEDMPICKHMVAVALAADAAHGGQGRGAGEDGKSPLAQYLESLPRERLVALVLDYAERFPEIHRSLDLAASKLVDDERVVLARFRRALGDAIDIDDYVDYAAASGWASNVDDVLDSITLLVDDGRAAMAMTLIEEAIEDLGPAMNMIDDSGGEIGGLIDRCREIHVKAAARIRPDPKDFAARLVEMVLEHEMFEASEIVAAYGEILGDAGLAEIERLASSGLDLLPSMKRGAKYADDPHRSERWSLTRLADDCAIRRGDVDARVALARRDLGHASDYLKIVEMLVAAGRDADALTWAREGLFVCEDDHDERLVTIALPLFDRAGHASEADRLVWAGFDAEPSKGLFDRLMERTEASARADVADRAIAHLEERLTRTDKGDPRRWSHVELLIDLLVGQGRFADAWSVVDRFQTPGMAGVVQRLVEASLASHPERATKIWRRQVEELVTMGGNRNYEAAHRLLRRLADVGKRSGTTGEHSRYVADLQTRHKAKRNFMKLFG